MKAKSVAICIFFVFLAVSLFSRQSVGAEWLDEFEDICSKVMIGDELTVEELQGIIERADKLKSVIEASENPSKKVYLMRLQKCRAFFEYAIELKADKKPDK